METLATVILKPGEADRIVAGHPWIYHGEILRLTAPVADGDLVQVKDHRQRLLGVGFFNSKSKINVRVLSPERVAVDETFFEERIRAALAVRQKHLPGATSFRVVNAESDFLSGLIVDKYEDVLVVQISALGMDQRKDADRRRAAKNLFARAPFWSAVTWRRANLKAWRKPTAPCSNPIRRQPLSTGQTVDADVTVN